MIKLYDSAFSPFARKVRMVLEHKGLNYEAVDGLLKSNHQALKAVNGRLEVPMLVDGDIVVVNSADIVAYLDDRYPEICSHGDLAVYDTVRRYNVAAANDEIEHRLFSGCAKGLQFASGGQPR